MFHFEAVAHGRKTHKTPIKACSFICGLRLNDFAVVIVNDNFDQVDGIRIAVWYMCGVDCKSSPFSKQNKNQGRIFFFFAKTVKFCVVTFFLR